MKTIKWFIPLLILSLAFSQQVKGQENDVLTMVEKMPEYPGGVDAMKEFIAENIEYPTEAKAEGIQGKVYVSFTIDKKGQVTDAEVVRGVHSALDKEALRVIGKMPAWKPGEQDGKPVNVRYTLPVAYKLGAENKKD